MFAARLGLLVQGGPACLIQPNPACLGLKHDSARLGLARLVKHGPARLYEALLIAGQSRTDWSLGLVEERQLGADDSVTDLEVLVGGLLPAGGKAAMYKLNYKKFQGQIIFYK